MASLRCVTLVAHSEFFAVFLSDNPQLLYFILNIVLTILEGTLVVLVGHIIKASGRLALERSGPNWGGCVMLAMG